MSLSSSTPFLSQGASRHDTDDHESESASISLGEEEGEKPFPPKRGTFRSSPVWNHFVVRLAIHLLAVYGLVSLALQIFRSFNKPYPPSHSHSSSHTMATEHRGNEGNSQYDVYRPWTLPPDRNLCSCGSTIEEARSLGCVYDPLATSWLPPYCRDDTVTQKFNKAGPNSDGSWPYYADQAGTIPLSIDEVAALGGTGKTFWASRRWHIAHCVFYWQKYWRMRETNAVMEDRNDKLSHVQHCGRLILNPVPEKDFLLEVPVTLNGSVAAVLLAGEGGHHHQDGHH